MANYLTFASAEPFTIGVNNATKNWDGILEYSTDEVNWTEWDGTEAIASAEHDGEQKIYMRGSGNTEITGGNYGWALDGSNIRCSGNIETLLDYASVENGEHPAMGRMCFATMFGSCYGLITAPELPAVALSDHCYYLMFCGCINLISSPKLPATTLAAHCYDSMFYNCFDLITIPELPATTLATYCYNDMFHGCENIKLSETQTEEYATAYRIPSSGDGTGMDFGSMSIFNGTGGAFTGFVSINTTYYTANRVIPAVTPEEPSVPFKPDPFSMTMGWLMGSRIAGQRGKPSAAAKEET